MSGPGKILPGPPPWSCGGNRTRLLSLMAVLFCLLGWARGRAQELAGAAVSQTAQGGGDAQARGNGASAGPGANAGAGAATSAGVGLITGAVVDGEGGAISGASVKLAPAASPGTQAWTAVTSGDGSFSFTGVPAGKFRITVTASGFAAGQASGEVHAGESYEMPWIALSVASNTEVEVSASPTEIAEAQVGEEEKQRVLGVFPNFYVSYVPDPAPLDPAQKFQLALRTLVDPVSLVLNGVTAGTEQATNTYAWGQGAQGYAKRYAAAYGTFMTGTLLGNAALPILFKQDPRYFYKGTGSVSSRTGYAIANAVVCKGDNHRWEVNYSGILGGLASAGLSNLYYPAVNRSGAGLTFEGAAIGTGFAAVANLLQEFLIHRLTPGIPRVQPAGTGLLQ